MTAPNRPGTGSCVRFTILALIAGCVTLNYLDRALLGISMPLIQREFQLSAEWMGVILSAFSWSYFLAQVPVGLLLDRFGIRPLYAGSLMSWSLVTLLHGFISGIA